MTQLIKYLPWKHWELHFTNTWAITPRLRMRRQQDPCNLLASQYSQISELQVQLEILYQEIRWRQMEEDTSTSDLYTDAHIHIHAHTNQINEAGEIAQSVKCSLCKNEDLSLDPECPCEKLFTMTWKWAGHVGTGRFRLRKRLWTSTHTLTLGHMCTHIHTLRKKSYHWAKNTTQW